MVTRMKKSQEQLDKVLPLCAQKNTRIVTLDPVGLNYISFFATFKWQLS